MKLKIGTTLTQQKEDTKKKNEEQNGDMNKNNSIIYDIEDGDGERLSVFNETLKKYNKK